MEEILEVLGLVALAVIGIAAFVLFLTPVGWALMLMVAAKVLFA